MQRELLVIENLNIFYSLENKNELKVLSDINLRINDSEILGVIGPNGSGKSTLLRCIAGLHNDYNGVMSVSNSVGFLFQEVGKNLIPWLSAKKNIYLPVLWDNENQKADETIVIEFLEEAGILSEINKYVGCFSGGQKQMVCLARWFLHKPELLLIDESWSMLDINQRKLTLKYLTQLKKEYKTSLIVVSHNINDIAIISDRVLIISNSTRKRHRIIDFSSITDNKERKELLWEETIK